MFCFRATVSRIFQETPSENFYTQAILKFLKLITQAQQREAVVQGRSLSPYRLRYKNSF
ncbi:MAG: hypothetical protein LBJ00_01955 [Planctomycetaceae bacterium]|nr:hypothetical protein [Planctomycetaceae bacterium]